MLDKLNGDDIAAEAKMVRIAFKGTILFVEGEDDINVYGKFIDKDQCVLIPCWGKKNLLEAIELLEREYFKGILGIVDADFWHILPFGSISENICVTDFHDLEILIIESQAFIYFLNEYGSRNKITEFLKKYDGEDIKTILYNIIYPIGVLRLISLKEGLGLKFRNMPYDRIINKDSLELNIDRLVQFVINDSHSKLAEKDLFVYYKKEIAELGEIDFSQICCGDDFVGLICVGLRKLLGSKSAQFAKRHNIASGIRLAYDSSYFKNTSLFGCIAQWEIKNNPYIVLDI